MCRPVRQTTLCLIFAGATVVRAEPTPPADHAAQEVLVGKGLHKRASFYVVPSELQLGKELPAAKKTAARLTAHIAQHRRYTEQLEARRREMLEYIAERRRLNEQLATVSDTLQHNRLVAGINGLNDRIRLLEAGLDEQGESTAIRGALGDARQEYIEAVTKLVALVDETRRQYDTLERDEQVRTALAALNETSRRTIRLGPRRNFDKHAVEVQRLESAIRSEAIELRERSNVFWIDVTLNDAHTRAMVLDTGASFISLPAAVAEQIGLVPTAQDARIGIRLADGRRVEAWRMKLRSARVGQFEVADVECVVLPPDVHDAPLLLGGSYLEHFVYQIDPQRRRLTLRRIVVQD